MKKLTLTLSLADHDALHEALDKVRSTSTTVKVPVAALRALLLDHSRLLRLHEGKLEGELA